MASGCGSHQYREREDQCTEPAFSPFQFKRGGSHPLSAVLFCPVAALALPQLHDLRHIHATTLLRASEAFHVVSARSGHADPSITAGVYAHVIRESNVVLL
jgi:integrase